MFLNSCARFAKRALIKQPSSGSIVPIIWTSLLRSVRTAKKNLDLQDAWRNTCQSAKTIQIIRMLENLCATCAQPHFRQSTALATIDKESTSHPDTSAKNAPKHMPGAQALELILSLPTAIKLLLNTWWPSEGVLQIAEYTVVILHRQFAFNGFFRCYSKITFKQRLTKMRTFEYICFEVASSS